MSSGTPRPEWLRVRAPAGKRVEEVSATRRHGLRTVCREARCPNVGECWGAGTATVILLGGVCTRGCAFCGVTAGTPAPPDPTEPDRVARAARDLVWRHVVVTSVTRDDLEDGGAEQFARVVRALRREAPDAAVELLVPDFGGDEGALRKVVDAAPDILAHNVETVPRLYPVVRRGAGVRTVAGAASAGRRDASVPSAQVRDHGGVRGDGGRGDRGLPGPLRCRVPVDHGGAVPVPLAGAPPGDRVREAGAVRRAGGRGAPDRL